MKSTKKMIMASMLAALCTVATIVLKFPTPPFGYINMGDVIVVVSGFLLSPFYGFLAAAVGSTLADVLLGYFMYAPVTFVIKGIMVVIVHFIYKATVKRINKNFSKILSAFVAECFMVIGYYVYEGILYGFVPSVVNIPLNCIQGLAAIILGTLIFKGLEKNKVNFK